MKPPVGLEPEEKMAATFIRNLEQSQHDQELRDYVVLVHRHAPGRPVRYFAGLHRYTHRPLYSYDVQFAKKFNPRDLRLLEAFVNHLQQIHGHRVHPIDPNKEKTMKRNGFSLLEMMLVLLIMSAVVCFAVPNPQQFQRAMDAYGAHKQVIRVRDSVQALAVCAAMPTPPAGCAQLVFTVPVAGQVSTGGYVFTSGVPGTDWTYTAKPLTGTGGMGLFRGCHWRDSLRVRHSRRYQSHLPMRNHSKEKVMKKFMLFLFMAVLFLGYAPTVRSQTDDGHALVVSSFPDGCEIFVDGVDTGQASPGRDSSNRSRQAHGHMHGCWLERYYVNR